MRSPIVIKLNRTMKKVWFMLAMLVCVLASCSGGGEDDPITPTPKPEVIKSEITIDSSIITNGLSFTHEKGEQSISFSTNENWTLSVASTTSGVTWCTASSTSGTKGTANVKFIVTENTDYDNRSVSVTIKSGTASKTFTVSQKYADALLVTTDKYEISQEGGIIDIEVKANIEYKMEISEEAKDWITESSGRGLTPYKHTFNISMNEEKEKRQGEVFFKNGDKVETVTIYQAGGAILLLLQDECHVSDKGNTISVNVQSNIEFGVQMPDVDWIVDEATSRGLSSHTLKYVIKANEGYDSRSAEIVFYDKNGDLKDTLKVVQAQKYAILLDRRSIKIDSNGGLIEVRLKTNIEYDIQMPNDDWINKYSSSRGLNEEVVYFEISKNTNEDERQTRIVFANTENNITDTLIVTQEGYKKVITLEKAGSLKKVIGDDAMNIISLKIIGSINGDDIFYLRRMLGAIEYDEKNRGKLAKLDLLEAEIVEGGEWYYSENNEKYYTENNTISKWLFYYCCNLEKIVLPRKTISISQNAFDHCVSLEEIIIPNNVISIEDFAFQCCYKLKSIIIPDNVTTLGRGCFYRCHALETIQFGTGLIFIKDGAFNVCKKIKEIVIPDNVVSIGYSAFCDCESLFKVTIGNGVKIIEERAFEKCPSLTTVILGKNVEEIGGEAFYNSPIIEFWSNSSIPPNIKDEWWGYAFNKDALKIDAILYVVTGSKSVYKNSDWGIFFRNIEEID